jgi:hypothetical protein
VSMYFHVEKKEEEWEALQKQLRPLLKHPRAEVGVVGEKASEKHGDGDITYGELAAVHEYGSPKRGIPERSYIRSTFEAKRKEYESFLGPLLTAFLGGRLTIKQVLNKWGEKVASDIVNRLLRGSPLTPPLSKRTIAARTKAAQKRQQEGGDRKLRDTRGRFQSLKGVGLRPLVETGQLAAAISWEVVMNPSKGES